MSAYLRWAIANQGKARFDLSVSGTREAPTELWLDPTRLRGNDASAPKRARQAIARYNHVDEKNVALTIGASHALSLACASVIKPGDDVLVEAPHYEPLRLAAELAGGAVRTFDVFTAEGGALDLVTSVTRALRGETRLVLLSSLHNPTGLRRSNEELLALAHVLEKQGAFLLVDEVYAAFDALTPTFTTSFHLANNILATSSLTKTLGLGPHRIGWMIANEAVMARASEVLLASVGHLPTTHAEVACYAFDTFPRLADRARSGVAAKRAQVTSALQGIPGLRFSAPPAGLFGFAWFEDGRDATPVLERALQEEEVLVTPGRFFGIDSGFRIAWSNEESIVSEGLVRLRRAIERPQREPR